MGTFWDQYQAGGKRSTSGSSGALAKWTSGSGGGGSSSMPTASASAATASAVDKQAGIAENLDRAEEATGANILEPIQGGLEKGLSLLNRSGAMAKGGVSGYLNWLGRGLEAVGIDNGLDEWTAESWNGHTGDDYRPQGFGEEIMDSPIGRSWRGLIGKEDYGVGDFDGPLKFQEGEDNWIRGVKMGLTGISEIGLDPLTYMSFGATGLAKGGAKAGLLGLDKAIKTFATDALKEGVDEASQAAMKKTLLSYAEKNADFTTLRKAAVTDKAAALETLAARTGRTVEDLTAQYGDDVTRALDDNAAVWGAERMSGEVQEAYNRLGGRGLRKWIADNPYLTKAQKDELWNAQYVQDMVGGARLGLPFTKIETNALRGGLDNAYLDKVKLGGAADAVYGARRMIRSNPAFQGLRKRMSGRTGAEYALALGAKAGSDDAIRAFDGWTKTAEADAFIRGEERDMQVMLANTQQTLDDNYAALDDATAGEVRTWQDKFYQDPTLVPDPASRVQELGWTYANILRTRDNDLYKMAQDAGVDVGFVDDFATRILTDDAAEFFNTNKTYDPTAQRKAFQTVLEFGEDGVTPVRVRWDRVDEANRKWREAGHDFDLFEADSANASTKYAFAMAKTVLSKRYLNEFARTGMTMEVGEPLAGRALSEEGLASALAKWTGQAKALSVDAAEARTKLDNALAREEKRVERLRQDLVKAEARKAPLAAKRKALAEAEAKVDELRGKIARVEATPDNIGSQMSDVFGDPRQLQPDARPAWVTEQFTNNKGMWQAWAAQRGITNRQPTAAELKYISEHLDEFTTFTDKFFGDKIGVTDAAVAAAKAKHEQQVAKLLTREQNAQALIDEAVALLNDKTKPVPQWRRTQLENRIARETARAEKALTEREGLTRYIDEAAARTQEGAAIADMRDALRASADELAAAPDDAAILAGRKEWVAGVLSDNPQLGRAWARRNGSGSVNGKAVDAVVDNPDDFLTFTREWSEKQVTELSDRLARQEAGVASRTAGIARDEEALYKIVNSAKEQLADRSTVEKAQGRLAGAQSRAKMVEGFPEAMADMQTRFADAPDDAVRAEIVQQFIDEHVTGLWDARYLREVQDNSLATGRRKARVTAEQNRNVGPLGNEKQSGQLLDNLVASFDEKRAVREQGALQGTYVPSSGLREFATARGWSVPGSGPAPKNGRLAMPAGLTKDKVVSDYVKSYLDTMYLVKDPNWYKKHVAPILTDFKLLATVGRLSGYVMRNIFGGVFNNIMMGVSLQDYKASRRVMFAFRHTAKEMDGRTWTSAAERQAAWDEAMKRQTMKYDDTGELYKRWVAARDQGLFSNNFQLEVLARTGQMDDFLATMGQRKERKLGKYLTYGRGRRSDVAAAVRPDERTKYHAGLNAIANNPYMDVAKAYSQLSEEFLRFAAFNKGARKYGLDDGGWAANQVTYASQFDYGDLSGFETDVMKTLIPFYVWSRMNLPLQMRMLIKEPRIALTANEIHSTLEAGAGDKSPEAQLRQKYLPEFAQDRGSFMLPFLDMALGQELPLQDLNRWTADSSNPMDWLGRWRDQAIGAASPLIKVPAEYVTGVDSFTGQKIDQDVTAPNWARMLGLSYGKAGEDEPQMSGQVYNAVKEAFPPLSLFENVLPVQQPQRTQDRYWSSVASSIFGLPVVTATDSSTAGAMRASNMDREDQMRREFARMYPNVDYAQFKELVNAEVPIPQLRAWLEAQQ